MAGHDKDNAPEALPPAGQPSWLVTFAGFCGVATLALAAGVLLVQFLENRPINLVPHTEELSRELLKAAREHVPEENIRIDGPEAVEHPRGRWNHYDVDILIPAETDMDGFTGLFEDALLDQYVRLVEEAGPAGEKRFTAYVGDQAFVDIRMHQARPATPAMDLRESCYRIARETRILLLDEGVAEASITLETPIERQEGRVSWALSRMQATMPPGRRPGELRGRLAAALRSREAEVRFDEVPGASLFRVTMEGRTCVEILAAHAPPPEKEAEEAGAESPAKEEPPPETPPPLEALPLDSAERALEGEGAPTPPPPRGKAAPAKVAIVLDDGGYRKPDEEPALALDTKITLAILPNTPYAGDVARAATEKGFEVILHMPMETHSTSIDPFPGQLNTAMKEAEIQRRTRHALAQVPGAAGANNHTGSKFAENREGLEAFLGVLKEEGLYFVDSRTYATTVGFQTAQAVGVPAAENNCFLDNKDDPAAIRKQLTKLRTKAQNEGAALGIGHFRKNTVSALAEVLPQWKKDGITLVHASEIVQ